MLSFAAPSKYQQRGNVLFLILIAVALFAALSYVVTSSTRSGSGSTERERAKMAAAEILQVVTAIRTDVLRKTISGIPTDSINFSSTYQKRWDGVTWNGDVNPRCGNSSCKVYDVASALPYRDFMNYANRPTTTGVKQGHLSSRYLCVGGIGTALPDIVLVIRNLDDPVCKAINEAAGLGYVLIDSNEVVQSWPYATATSAQYDSTCTSSTGSSVTQFLGKQYFCASFSGGGAVNSSLFTIIER